MLEADSADCAEENSDEIDDMIELKADDCKAAAVAFVESVAVLVTGAEDTSDALLDTATRTFGEATVDEEASDGTVLEVVVSTSIVDELLVLSAAEVDVASKVTLLDVGAGDGTAIELDEVKTTSEGEPEPKR